MANFLRLLPNYRRPFRSTQFLITRGECKGNQVADKAIKKSPGADGNYNEAPLLDSSLILMTPKEKTDKLKLTQEISVQQEDLRPVSFIPESYSETRRARIYVPAKNAMQSGQRLKIYWRVDFDTKERWQNPCMGWSSSGDAISNIHLAFNTKEEAIAFCERNGWCWYVNEPTSKKPKIANYTANFVFDKRTRVSTK